MVKIQSTEPFSHHTLDVPLPGSVFQKGVLLSPVLQKILFCKVPFWEVQFDYVFIITSALDLKE